MRTLIINGSPRKNGDTAALIAALRSELSGEVVEISAYRDKISPCVDCRYCYEHAACAIHDDMQTVYDDDYDNVIIASPVYYGILTPPLMALASRLQIHHSAKHMRGEPIELRQKRGAVMLVGGGKGNPEGAFRLARVMLRILNAEYDETQAVGSVATSFDTDTLAARDDGAALAAARAIARRLNA